jgi:hypothetical protein
MRVFWYNCLGKTIVTFFSGPITSSEIIRYFFPMPSKKKSKRIVLFSGPGNEYRKSRYIFQGPVMTEVIVAFFFKVPAPADKYPAIKKGRPSIGEYPAYKSTVGAYLPPWCSWGTGAWRWRCPRWAPQCRADNRYFHDLSGHSIPATEAQLLINKEKKRKKKDWRGNENVPYIHFCILFALPGGGGKEILPFLDM